MDNFQFKAGDTSRRIPILIQDSSSVTGAGLPGLVYNSAGLVCYVGREDDGNAAGTVVALATMTRGTWATGGFVEKDATHMPGVYEFSIPNASLAAGSKWAAISFMGAANMVPQTILIQLTAVDPYDATAMGISRLDAAVSAAVSDSSGVTTLLGRVPGTVQPQTGDAYARVGAAGAGLTAIGDTRIANLDAAVSSRLAPAGTLANLTNAPTAGDFTAAMKTSLNSATPAVTVSDKTGFSLSAGGVQAIWDALVSALTTVGSIGKLLVTNIDAAISSRSTYAGADTAGTTTLLGRLTGTRAANLDNLDAAVSSRSTYGGTDTAGTTTLLGRIPGTVQPQTGDAYGRLGAPAGASVSADVAAVKNDLDGGVSLTSGYQATLVAAVWAAGTRTLTSLGTVVADTATAVWAAGARTLTAFGFSVTVGTNSDKTGYALTTAEHTAIATDTETGLTAQGYTTARAAFLDVLNGLVTAIWAAATRTLSAFGFTVSTDVAGVVATNLDVRVSTRSTYSGGPVASVAGDVGGNVLGSVAGTVEGVVGLNTALIDAAISSRATPGDIPAVPTAQENADEILTRDWAAVSGEAAHSVLNALRGLGMCNKVTVDYTAKVITVFKEDGASTAYTIPITTQTGVTQTITGVSP